MLPRGTAVGTPFLTCSVIERTIASRPSVLLARRTAPTAASALAAASSALAIAFAARSFANAARYMYLSGPFAQRCVQRESSFHSWKSYHSTINVRKFGTMKGGIHRDMQLILIRRLCCSRHTAGSLCQSSLLPFTCSQTGLAPRTVAQRATSDRGSGRRAGALSTLELSCGAVVFKRRHN